MLSSLTPNNSFPPFELANADTDFNHDLGLFFLIFLFYRKDLFLQENILILTCRPCLPPVFLIHCPISDGFHQMLGFDVFFSIQISDCA